MFLVYTINMDNINRRIKIIFVFVLLFFIVISFCLFRLCILKNNEMNKLLSQKTDKIYFGEEAPRGNIYDVKGRLLVGNKLVKSIVYNKNNLNELEELKLASKVSDNLNINYDNLMINDIKEYLYVKNKDELFKRFNEDEIINYENKKYSNLELKNLLKSKIKENELNISDKEKKISYIYKLMNKGYSYEEKTIKEDVSEKEYAYFSENESEYKGISAKTKYKRIYPYKNTFRTFLGNVGSIPKEEKNKYIKLGYNMNDTVGISYLEKKYEKYLKGTKEKYKVDAKGNRKKLNNASRGNDLYLTIDIELQKDIEKLVKEELKKSRSEPNTRYFNKSFIILSNPNDGSILASVGKQIIKKRGKYSFVDVTPSLVMNPVTPGSIVKGASHIVGYKYGNVKFGYSVRDSCIKLPNTPPKCSWTRLGVVNDLTALSMSSNYYQFIMAIKVGNGSYSYNRGIKLNKSGFKKYRNTYKEFGLGSSTGIDLPKEGNGFIGNDKKVNHLLDFPIGQYDTYTPFQIIQYINTLAMSGNRYSLHYLDKVYSGKDNNKVLYNYDTNLLNRVDAKEKYFKRVKKGLKMVTTSGTGKGYINSKYHPSGKTGTSQSFIDTNGDGNIDTETISTLFGAYMPRENPKLSIVVISPDVSVKDDNYKRSSITKRLTNKVTNLYFKKYK